MAPELKQNTMGDSRKLAELISELSDLWIGKAGVWAIFDELKGNTTVIKFLVSNLETNRTRLPKQYKGIPIELEETQGVFPL
ncbi:MAG: hypothetical protein NW226_23280 [Microscillaceae bacterium]|nr:hypothetical protein [Microscillaceae bacterium]